MLRGSDLGSTALSKAASRQVPPFHLAAAGEAARRLHQLHPIQKSSKSCSIPCPLNWDETVEGRNCREQFTVVPDEVYTKAFEILDR